MRTRSTQNISSSSSSRMFVTEGKEGQDGNSSKRMGKIFNFIWGQVFSFLSMV